MAENFLNMAKDINLHTEEAEKTPYRINTNKSSPRLTVKLLKTKDKESLHSSKREMIS